MSFNKKIFLVEDEPLTATLLLKQLVARGYSVTHFNSGEKVTEAVLNSNKTCHLILMDIDLGMGINGPEAAKIILNKKDIPIVFISSHTSQEVVEKTEEITSYGYIFKNAGITVIDASIKMALKLFEAKKEIETHKNNLKISEEKYRKLTENISDILWTADLNLMPTYVSASVEKILGESPEQHMKKKPEERYPPNCMKIIKAELAHELEIENTPGSDKNRTKIIEIQHYHANGSLLWLSMNISAIRDNNGNIIGFQGVSRDITQQKNAEFELLESNNRHKAILQALPDIMFIFSKNGVFLDYHTPNDESLLLSPNEFLGKNASEILPPPLAEINQERINKLFSTNKPQHYSYSVKVSGKTNYFDARMVKYGQEKALSIVRDVTDKHYAEEKLLHSHNLMKYIIEHNRTAIAVHDKDLKYIYVSQRYLTDYKVKEKDIIGKHHYEVFPDIPGKWKDVHKRALAGEVVSSEEDKYVKANGQIEWTRWECRPWYESDETVGGIIIYTEVITERKQVEENLKERNRFIQTIMDNLPIGVALNKINEGKAIYINKKFEEIYGWDKSVITDISAFFKNVYPDRGYREKISKQIYEDIKSGDAKRMQWENIKITRSDGSNRIVNATNIPLFDQNTMVSTVTDITKLKKAEESLRNNEEKYRLIFDKSPLGVFHFNNKGIITECNDHFETSIGTKKEKLQGLNLFENPNKELIAAVKKVLKGKASSFEGIYSFVSINKIIPVRILFSPVFNSERKTIGGIGLLEDKSSLIEKEKLEKQVAIAKESVNFKQKFLANMSHEIRTPLTGMLGFTEMLSKTELSKEQKSYLDILKHSGENLKEIINLILDYSKIESGQVKLKLKAFSADTIFDSSMGLYSSIFNKGVKLITHIDPKIPKYIKTDQNRLNQIINNLVSNAVKYTKTGSISLKASLQEEIKKNEYVKIKIEVADTGPGISKEAQKSLFKPFTQVETGEIRSVEGTGLGLAICKELTAILDGEIGVTSKLNHGSTFWFTFIAKKAKVTEVEKTEKILTEKNIKSKIKSILLVDDKKINQMVVTIMLESLGHSVECASNGKEALKKFKPGKYDIVLMDIQMPEMDGIMATKILKEKYKNMPPVIGLSANAFEGDREKYMKQGLDEYLTKPVKIEDFNEILNRLH